MTHTIEHQVPGPCFVKGPHPFEECQERPANQFVTKDSGVRAEFEGGMVRDSDEGKPRFDLCAPLGVPFYAQLMTRWALLMGRGAAKYGDRNWEKGRGEEVYRRAKASAYRHFMQWYHDEVDEDHAVAVFFNIQAAEYFRERQ